MTMKRVDLIGNSPYCLPYNSYGVSSQNMVLDLLTTPLLIFVAILITCELDIVLLRTMCLSAYCVISFQASFRRGFGSPRQLCHVMTAIVLEATHPVVPLTVIARLL